MYDTRSRSPVQLVQRAALGAVLSGSGFLPLFLAPLPIHRDREMILGLYFVGGCALLLLGGVVTRGAIRRLETGVQGSGWDSETFDKLRGLFSKTLVLSVAVVYLTGAIVLGIYGSHDFQHPLEAWVFAGMPSVIALGRLREVLTPKSSE